MSEQLDKNPCYVICNCQHCGANIQFDASGLSLGEICPVECANCHLVTEISVPLPEPPPLPKTKKVRTRSVKKWVALSLWITTAVVACWFMLVSGQNLSDDESTAFTVTLLYLFIASIVVTLIPSTKGKIPPVLPQYKLICANCGSLLVRTTSEGACGICFQRTVVPLGTPRGAELLATYHGSVSAKERVEIADEANKRLLLTLEPTGTSGGLAVQLEKLAGLVRIGAITNDEWQRAKALYLGQPKDKQESALARIQQLHGLLNSGALSESEFNTVKWDILAKGMAKGIS